MADSHPLWLSTAEAARLLGVTPRTVYGFINDGTLPAYRMGRVIRIKADDIDVFIGNARIRPGELGDRADDPSPEPA